MNQIKSSVIQAQSVIFSESLLKHELKSFLESEQTPVDYAILMKSVESKIFKAMNAAVNTCESLNLIKSIEDGKQL